MPAILIEAAMTEPPESILRLDLPPDYLQRSERERLAMFSPFMEELEAALDALPRDVLYGIGFDFGRVSDLSVAPILSIEKDLTRRCRLMIEMRGVPYAEQKDVMRAIITALLSCLIGAAFDATGGGAEVAETMAREFGAADANGEGGLVHEIKLSQEWYRINMPPVKAAFEDGTITLGKDVEVLADFRLVKVIRGVPKVPDIRTGEKGKKRHGDAAIGVVLGYYATRMQYFAYGYKAVTIGSGREPNRFYDQPPDEDERDGDFLMGSLKTKQGLL